MTKIFSIALPDELVNDLQVRCMKMNVARNAFIRGALEQACNTKLLERPHDGAKETQLDSTKSSDTKLTARIERIERDLDRKDGNEQLWKELSDVKAMVREIKGLFEGIILGLLKSSETNEKLVDAKMIEVLPQILKKLGYTKERE